MTGIFTTNQSNLKLKNLYVLVTVCLHGIYILNAK